MRDQHACHFPGFNAFYEFGDPYDEDAIRGTPRDVPLKALRLLARGEWRPPRPILFDRAEGRVPADVVHTTSIRPVIVHQRVVDILRSEGLTGWATFPVELRDEAGRILPDYFGFAVTGRSGPPAYRRGSMVAVDYPGGTFVEYKGRFFDPVSWDGSDVFHTGEWGFIFVTDALVDAFNRGRLTNTYFRPLTDILTSPSVAGPNIHFLDDRISP